MKCWQDHWLQEAPKPGMLAMYIILQMYWLTSTTAYYINLGKLRLNSVTVGRYEHQRSYYKSAMANGANRFKDTVMPAGGTPLTPDYDVNYRVGYDSVYQQHVRLALLQQFVLTLNKDQ